MQAFRLTLTNRSTTRAMASGVASGAYNWAVATLKADIGAFPVSDRTAVAVGAVQRWNTVKDEAVRVLERGLRRRKYWRCAVDAYWNWQNSRSGKREGKHYRLPVRAGRDQDRDISAAEPDAVNLTSGRRDRPVRTTHAGFIATGRRGCWQFGAVTAPGSTPCPCNDARKQPQRGTHSPVHGLTSVPATTVANGGRVLASPTIRPLTRHSRVGAVRQPCAVAV